MRNLLKSAAAAGLILVIGSWAWNAINAPAGSLFAQDTAGLLLALGQLAGLLAVFGILLQLVLVSRARWVEPVFGLDRLTRFHHIAGLSIPLALIAHPILVTSAHALREDVSFLAQYRAILGWEDVPGALAGEILIVAAVVLSLPSIRRRMRYEWWHASHLLTYLGLLLSVGHQMELGGDVAGNPVFGWFWKALFLFAVGNIVYYRAFRQLRLYRKHRFFVERVVRETDDVVSIHIGGSDLESLPAEPGQFVIVRFWTEGLRWEEHPFSLSRPSDGKTLRLSVKKLGDFTAKLQSLSPGIPVLVDGPHGAFTAERSRQGKVLLVAGGIGITPLRSMAERFPAGGKDCVLVYGNRTRTDIVFEGELQDLAARGGLRIHHVVSSDPDWTGEKGYVDTGLLRRLVPDCAGRDVFVCGPPPMMAGVLKALEALGVPPRQVHYERFSL